MGWQDDLRDVVEQRGGDLQQLAADRLAAATEPDGGTRAEPDPAEVEQVFDDALVAVLARRQSTRGAGTGTGVHIVVDSRVEDLTAAVRREIEQRVPLDASFDTGGDTSGAVDPYARGGVTPGDRPSGRPPEHCPPEHRPPGHPSSRTADLLERVRRRRRARLLRGAGVVGALATVVAVLGVLNLLDAPAPVARDAPTGQACPTRLEASGDAVVPVSVEPLTTRFAASGTFSAVFETAADGGLAERTPRLLPTVWLTRDKIVVGVGTETAQRGSSRGVAVSFRSCATGGLMAPGTYAAVVSSAIVDADGSRRRLVSQPVRVTVLKDLPDGAQPSWLDSSPLACGESLADLATRTSEVTIPGLTTVSVTGTASGARAVVRNDRPVRLNLGGPSDVVALWVQHDRVVGVGPDEQFPGRPSLAPGERATLTLPRWDLTNYCVENADGQRPYRLDPGTYQVVLYSRYIVDGDLSRVRWYFSAARPLAVVVTDELRVEVVGSDRTVARG